MRPLAGYVLADAASGVVLDADDAALRLIGRTREELSSIRVGELSLFREFWHNLQATGSGHTTISAPGTELEISGRRTTIGDGNVAVVVVRDLSCEQELERSALARADDATRATNDLQQFAYVTSHDLQEPLRTVTSFAQLLSQRYKGRLDTEADEYIAYITDAASRMSGLIKDLVAYSRVLNVGEARRVPVSLEAAAAWAIMNLAPAAKDSGAEITRDPLPTVEGYEQQFVQLFHHLLHNALKFRSEAPPRIHMGAAQEDGLWHISVADNGVGIDPQHHDRIFGVFKRLHGREVPGNGMGLALCRRIVEQHGGRMWVESQPGAGATFHLTLPA